MTISDAAKAEIMKNVKLRAALMYVLNVGEKSITNWVERDDIRLTTEAAVVTMVKETELTREQILVSDKVSVL